MFLLETMYLYMIEAKLYYCRPVQTSFKTYNLLNFQ